MFVIKLTLIAYYCWIVRVKFVISLVVRAVFFVGQSYHKTLLLLLGSNVVVLLGSTVA